MKADNGWTITLFPSLPMALLALVRITPSPSLVLVEDKSILYTHVSAMSLGQQGYVIRTFTEQLALESSGRQKLVPSFRLVVHQNLAALNDRLLAPGAMQGVEKTWDHVENLSERDFFERSTGLAESFDSATLRLPGCPGGVALLLRGHDQTNARKAIEGMGLRYQGKEEL